MLSRLSIYQSTQTQKISACFSIHQQTSIEYIPPPSKWTPAWTARMKKLDMSAHLGYIQSFMIKSKEIQSEIAWKRLSGEDWSKEEQFPQQVVKCNCALCSFCTFKFSLQFFLP